MTPSLPRRLLCMLLLAGASVLLVLGFAWPGQGVPWTPQHARELPLAEFASKSSQVSLTEGMVRAEGVDAQGATRLFHSVAGLLAADYRYFAFDVDEVPTVSKLMLVWQGSEGQGIAALPETPFGRGTIDLSRLDAWKGSIESIGLVVMPTDYLSAAAVKESKFALRAAHFESAGWSASLRALASEWTAYRPWTGRSNNTGGTELAGGAGPSLQAFMMVWLLCALATLGLCVGWVRARTIALPLMCSACVILALLQVRQLALRAAVAHHAAALVQDQPTLPLAAQPQLAVAAQALSKHIDATGERPRVLVHGATQFFSEYATWLLRTQDAATLALPEQLPAQDKLSGWLLVLVGPGDWEHVAGSDSLRLGAQERRASLYIDAGVMKAYRFETQDSEYRGDAP